MGEISNMKNTPGSPVSPSFCVTAFLWVVTEYWFVFIDWPLILRYRVGTIFK
jgi:hypothetical protein